VSGQQIKNDDLSVWAHGIDVGVPILVFLEATEEGKRLSVSITKQIYLHAFYPLKFSLGTKGKGGEIPTLVELCLCQYNLEKWADDNWELFVAVLLLVWPGSDETMIILALLLSKQRCPERLGLAMLRVRNSLTQRQCSQSYEHFRDIAQDALSESYEYSRSSLVGKIRRKEQQKQRRDPTLYIQQSMPQVAKKTVYPQEEVLRIQRKEKDIFVASEQLLRHIPKQFRNIASYVKDLSFPRQWMLLRYHDGGFFFHL